MNSDLIELLLRFNAGNVKYLVVGGVAFIHHAEPRFTKDLDVWVQPVLDNAERVFRCLAEFGAPIGGMRPEDFTDENAFFQMGVPPNRVDILMSVSGLKFDVCWDRRGEMDYFGVPAHVVSREDLIASKAAAGRPRDLADLDTLRLPIRPASDFAPGKAIDRGKRG